MSRVVVELNDKPSEWSLDLQLFCSPNSSNLPVVPDKPSDSRPALDMEAVSIDFQRVFLPSWATGRSPQSAFVPCVLDEADSLLGSLAFRSDRPPIHEMDSILGSLGLPSNYQPTQQQAQVSRWAMTSSLARQWSDLEILLRRCANALNRHLSSASLIPLDFGGLQQRATSLKLADPRGTRKEMRSVLLRARKCLILDAAMVSLLVAIWQVFYPNPSLWQEMLRADAGGNINADDMDRIIRSTVVNWATERVGAFLPITRNPWSAQILRACRHAQVPLYIWCGPFETPYHADPTYHSTACFADYTDRASVISDPYPHDHLLYDGEPTIVREGHEVIEPTNFPRRFSGAPGDFIQSRRVDNDFRKTLYSQVTQKAIAEHREFWAHARNSNFPVATNPPASYLWCLIDSKTLLWSQSLMHQKEVEALWDHPSYVIWYDELAHEWHFIPHNQPLKEERTNVPDSLSVGHSQTQLGSHPASGYPDDTTEPFFGPELEVRISDPPTLDGIQDPIDSTTACLNEITVFLHERYGFDAKRDTQLVVRNPPSWEEAARICCFPDAVVEDAGIQERIINFVHVVAQRDAQNFRALCPLSTFKSSWTVRKTVREEEDPARLGQTPQALVERVRYLLESPTDTWAVLVEDATTALQCMRFSGVSTCEQLVKELGKRLIPFSTRIPRPQIALPADEAARRNAEIYHYTHHVGLGWRESTRKPTAEDAARYYDDLASWARTPRARAAVLAGGLYAAIVSWVDKYLVLMGPSCWAREYAYGDVIVDGCGREWIDDALTTAEKDLICGTYLVHSGMWSQRLLTGV